MLNNAERGALWSVSDFKVKIALAASYDELV